MVQRPDPDNQASSEDPAPSRDGTGGRPGTSDPQLEAARIASRGGVIAGAVTAVGGFTTALTVAIVTGLFQYNGPGGAPEPTATVTSTVVVAAPFTNSPPDVPSGRPEQLPPWPGEPAGAPYNTGSPVLSLSNDNTLDFEGNELRWDQHATDEFDAMGGDDGLGVLNGTGFARWAGARAPRLRDCRQVGEGDWAVLVDVDQFVTPSMFCIRSAEGRYGYLKTRRVVFWSQREGAVRELHLSFVLWKKPGDR